MPIKLKPLSGVLGAEIEGVDLGKPVDGSQLKELRDAFSRYHVICFREQVLTPEQHLGFARQWGRINVNRFFKPVEGFPMIAEVSKEPDQKKNIGEDWHTDHSYDEEPAFASILYARRVPDFGGDTLFSSMCAAYDALSDGLKSTLAGLKARHSSRHVFGYVTEDVESRRTGRIANPDLAIQDSIHPVVVKHPGSGRPALYVNPDFTVGFENWSDDESRSLLEYLYRHAGQPRFTCRLSWQAGTLAVWDNRCTWHCAMNDYHGQRRLMHRITLEGEPLSL